MQIICKLYIDSGFKTETSTEDRFAGSYINGSICYAENHPDSDGVYAIARCCDLREYSITCSTYQSGLSGITDDDRIYIECLSEETILGWYVYTYCFQYLFQYMQLITIDTQRCESRSWK